MKYIVVFIALIIGHVASGQNNFIPDEMYVRFVGKAHKLYEEKRFRQSGLTYDSAFAGKQGNGMYIDFYNAACTWALAGDREKAFSYLDRAVAQGQYSNLSHIQSDLDLMGLRGDKRWDHLLAAVAKNKEEKEKKLNRPLMAILAQIYKEDQAYRNKMDSVEAKFGWESAEMQSLFNTMQKKDSINLIQVKSIIDKHGWLGPDEVGEQGASTLFLVIQHADYKTQVKYFPLLADAVKKGKARPQDLGYLEDRILVKEGKEQIYGSQVRTNESGVNEFFSIKDEVNVNKRRASVGLGPLEDYARHFGIEYKLPMTK